MSDASNDDDLDAIREQKKQELQDKLTGTDSPETPIHIEDTDHFAEVTGRDGPVLVDFYADWCGPCQMLEPTVEAVAAETAATVAKVDIDALQALAREYNVQGVPTLMLFVDGEVTEELVGMQDEATLTTLIAQHAE